jgi:hypothetical protein
VCISQACGRHGGRTSSLAPCSETTSPAPPLQRRSFDHAGHPNMSFRVSSTKHTAVGRWWRTVIGSYFSVASPEYKRRTGTWRCSAYRICSSFGVQQSAGAAPCSPTPANRRSSDHGEQTQLGPRRAGAVSSTSSPARGAVQTSAFSPAYRRGSALGVQVWRSPRRTGCSHILADGRLGGIQVQDDVPRNKKKDDVAKSPSIKAKKHMHGLVSKPSRASWDHA